MTRAGGEGVVEEDRVSLGRVAGCELDSDSSSAHVSFHDLFAALARGADDLTLGRLMQRCAPVLEAYVASLARRSFPQLGVDDVDAVVAHVFDRVLAGMTGPDVGRIEYRGGHREASARAWIKRTAWRKACDRARQLESHRRQVAAAEAKAARRAEAERTEAADLALAERVVPLLFWRLDRVDRAPARRERMKQRVFLFVEHVWTGASSGEQAERHGYLPAGERFDGLDAKAQRKVRLLVDQHRRRGRERAAELLADLVAQGVLRSRDALAFACKHKVPTADLAGGDTAVHEKCQLGRNRPSSGRGHASAPKGGPRAAGKRTNPVVARAPRCRRGTE